MDTELCTPCIITKPALEKTQDIPNTLCPCDIVVLQEIPIVKKQITNYCLQNFLTELVYMKNCNKTPHGC